MQQTTLAIQLSGEVKYIDSCTSDCVWRAHTLSMHRILQLGGIATVIFFGKWLAITRLNLETILTK